jgi:hypothetical protein
MTETTPAREHSREEILIWSQDGVGRKPRTESGGDLAQANQNARAVPRLGLTPATTFPA